MRCQEVDYEILGDDMQIVKVELDPAEKVIAEAGAMNYMEDGIAFETKMGEGSVLAGLGDMFGDRYGTGAVEQSQVNVVRLHCRQEVPAAA